MGMGTGTVTAVTTPIKSTDAGPAAPSSLLVRGDRPSGRPVPRGAVRSASEHRPGAARGP
ncbi:hypothetical protein SBD_5114 [Streptomyces bottropensis ATCC 25435]|uniref:Uncharacterized protein n=1 Tax=Streptomyces bottropensis ATCC 25435 TaxID=1054862 RepID=M3FKV1_9ACTN|nr:hypothetical protein SBD_5114 [Streptomyces bottropensis ATCC 25435]